MARTEKKLVKPNRTTKRIKNLNSIKFVSENGKMNQARSQRCRPFHGDEHSQRFILEDKIFQMRKRSWFISNKAKIQLRNPEAHTLQRRITENGEIGIGRPPDQVAHDLYAVALFKHARDPSEVSTHTFVERKTLARDHFSPEIFA